MQAPWKTLHKSVQLQESNYSDFSISQPSLLTLGLTLSLPGLSRTPSAALPKVNLIPVATGDACWGGGLEGTDGVQSVLVLGLHLPIQADSDHESGSQQPTLCLLGSIKGVLILPLSPNCEHQTPLFQSLNCSILQWTFQQQNAPSCYTEFLYNSITYWCQNTELN